MGERESPSGSLTEPEPRWKGAATVVLVAETPKQRRWAEERAAQLASELVRRRKLVLADLTLGTFSIAGAASPGVSDVLFGGVQLARAVRQPPTQSFFVLPSGSSPPSLTALFRHQHWPKIAAHFRRADACLLLCVAADDWLAAGPITAFEASIVLNATGRNVEPPGGAWVDAEFVAPREIRNDSAGAPWRYWPGGAAFGAGTWTRAKRLTAVVTSGAAVLAGFALWQAVGSKQILPDSESLEAAASPLEMPSGDGSSAGSRGERGLVSMLAREHSLPYSVLIASFSAFDDAWARGRQWARPGVIFYVAPTVVRGVIYYRVFAGAFPDRDQATEIMEELVRDGLKESAHSWDVRPARYAFSFGTFPDREGAEARVQALHARGVPAYVVRAPGPDGEIAHRVYAGGYEKPEDARPLREQIVRSRLEAELVERVGVSRR